MSKIFLILAFIFTTYHFFFDEIPFEKEASSTLIWLLEFVFLILSPFFLIFLYLTFFWKKKQTANSVINQLEKSYHSLGLRSKILAHIAAIAFIISYALAVWLF